MRKLFGSWAPHWVVHRDLLGSDIVIVATIFLHLVYGISFLSRSDADWPIGMHALMSAAHHGHVFAGSILIGACVLAAIGEWGNGMIVPGLRAVLLMGQLLILCIPAWGVGIAVAKGQFPCSTLECIDPLSMPRIGLLDDQLHGLIWPIVYGICAYVRVRRR